MYNNYDVEMQSRSYPNTGQTPIASARSRLMPVAIAILLRLSLTPPVYLMP